MINQFFYGREGGETFRGWRCIHCGEIIDEVILENRGKGEKKHESLCMRMCSHIIQKKERRKDYVSKINSSDEICSRPIEEG